MTDPLIREWAAWLGQHRDTFVAQLHADIQPLLTEVSGDGWPLCERLVDTLLWVPFAAQPQAEIENTLRWVGGQGRLEGFTEDRYTEVARALVRTLRSMAASQWSTPLGSAWISYFMSLQPHLTAGAVQAENHPAVAEADRERLREREARHREQQIATGDVDLESVGNALAEEEYEDDEEDVGYGQIMLSMTISGSRKDRPGPQPGTRREPGGGPLPVPGSG
jgi:hypothetical protein